MNEVVFHKRVHILSARFHGESRDLDPQLKIIRQARRVAKITNAPITNILCVAGHALKPCLVLLTLDLDLRRKGQEV